MILSGKNEIYNILISLCHLLAKLWTTNTAKKKILEKTREEPGRRESLWWQLW